MKTDEQIIKPSIPGLVVYKRKYKKISAFELITTRNYFIDMDKIQLLQKHGLSESDYDIVKQKLVYKKKFAEIANLCGRSPEWARQMFIKVIIQLTNCTVR